MSLSVVPQAFHITPASHLDAILSGGLVPRTGPRAQALGETASMIYLFPDGDSLLGALESWVDDAFAPDDTDTDTPPLALLAVDLGGIPTFPGGAGFEICCPHPIPPNRLQLLSRDALELTPAALETLLAAPAP